MGRNTLKLDLSGFEELIAKLEGLDGDVKGAVSNALKDAAQKVKADTYEAVQKPNLPAKGKYSKGNTERSIVDNPRTEWSGTTASISVGFDYSKPGAGGYLITGTPRMRPARKLNRIYKGKEYRKEIQNFLQDKIQQEIDRQMGG